MYMKVLYWNTPVICADGSIKTLYDFLTGA